jgi:predicted TIM-barrel fold metal-dependent hydrolase
MSLIALEEHYALDPASTQDPDAETAELESAVNELGLVGGLTNGHCQGRYLDGPAYEDLFACADSMGMNYAAEPTRDVCFAATVSTATSPAAAAT